MGDTISYALKASAQQILGSLAHICRTAETYAKEMGYEETALLEARLYPDMFPMVRQVQIATDIARRGAMRLAGETPIPLEDDDVTFAALAARCETALTDIMAQPDAALDEGPDSEIVMEIPSGELRMTKREFLVRFTLPNMIFHASTAYALLRMQGVPLGKMDFLNEGKAPGS
ncbi:MAG: DUF1993 domain-containing protein [Pseudomonadota bacterium]